jgi:D-alanine-D-alanine ligase
MKTVAVLKGGWSGEREVSLSSAAPIEKALLNLGYTVKSIDLKRDLKDLLDQLTPKPDVVYNALHGKWGEDGCIQGVLDILEIPYTHSGRMASELAMNKHIAIELFRKHNIPVAESYVTTIDEALDNPPLDPPYVIKPVCEGSSLGVHLVLNGQKPNITPSSWEFDPTVLVERYIPGVELSVAVMGSKALGVLQLNPENAQFYNYDAKYTDGITKHIMPAPIPQDIYDDCMHYAGVAHEILGCRGVSRTDFRYDESLGKNGLFILEHNTQPGFTPLSIVPEIAAYSGISFEQLVKWIVEEAQCDA